jgi:hypothetical protein
MINKEVCYRGIWLHYNAKALPDKGRAFVLAIHNMVNTYTLSITQQVNTLNRAERYPGVGAVSREGGGLAVVPGSPCLSELGAVALPPAAALGGGKRKLSKIQKMARRGAWLRGAGGYVHIGQYYKPLLTRELESDTNSLESRLSSCHHTWIREAKGDKSRWRGVGCGERDICPICGSYHSWVLAREAIESMTLAQTAVEVGGEVVETYGLKLVLPIPQTESERIDRLLHSDTSAWESEQGELFKLGYAFVKRWFGDGCGGVVSIHYTGESNPAKPHYHLNIYIFPARRVGTRWLSLGRWIEPERIADMRHGWRDLLNKNYGLRLADADFEAGYLGKTGKFKGWMQYLYKHVLADLWAGWQGVEGDDVLYKADKKSPERQLKGEDLTAMCERLPVRYHYNDKISVGLIPAHFKRIRWFGVFSDGQRAKTMESLGLEAVNLDEKDDGESQGWVQSNDVARFVRFEPQGVVLREVLKDEAGEIIRDEVMGEDGWPHWVERLGEEFLVPDRDANCSPSGVSMGKRKRWREPGA